MSGGAAEAGIEPAGAIEAPPGEPTPLRVAIVASTMRMGGAERSTFELAARLANGGDHVALFCLRARGPVGDMFAEAKIPVRDGIAPIGRDPRAGIRLARVLRAGRFDVVYLLDHTNAVVWGTLGALLAGVRARLVIMHTTGLAGGGSSVPRGLRAAFPFLTGLVATAHGQSRYLLAEGVPRRKLVTVRNGVPLPEPPTARARELIREEIGLAPDDVVVGMTAMLRPEKGHEIFFEAIAALLPEHPRLRAVLVGEGPRRAALLALRDRLGLSRVVTFLGARPDAPRLAAAFDVAVLSSHPRVETLPFALLEALAMGVPVVATRVGSLEELVESGRAGTLVPPGDSAAFAAALGPLLSDRAARATLGANGRSFVERTFGVDRMVEETRGLFRAAASGRRLPGVGA